MTTNLLALKVLASLVLGMCVYGVWYDYEEQQGLDPIGLAIIGFLVWWWIPLS